MNQYFEKQIVTHAGNTNYHTLNYKRRVCYTYNMKVKSEMVKPLEYKLNDNEIM